MCCRLHQQNREFLNADEDSDVWKAYVDYVDEIIVDGFFNTILCSLKFMIENTDAKTTTEPFYEAVLELQVCSPHHFYYFILFYFILFYCIVLHCTALYLYMY